MNAWWSGLRAAERRQLSALVDPRAESCSYSRTARADGSSVWYGLSIRLRGHFVEQDRARPEDTFPVDLYEYAVDHEIWLAEGPAFHVCTQHAAAREAVRAGLIPASFSCPLREEGCPMRHLLALARVAPCAWPRTSMPPWIRAEIFVLRPCCVPRSWAMLPASEMRGPLVCVARSRRTHADLPQMGSSDPHAPSRRPR